MFCKSLNSNSAEATFIKVTVLIFFLISHFTYVFGVPINFANNKNYNENYASRPLPQPPQRQHPPVYQQPQNSQNQGPEMEDFGRLHMNRNQFRRHANAYPSEQFRRSSDSLGAGTNFRHSQFEDSYQQQNSNHNSRHQRSATYYQGQEEEDEVQDFHQRFNDQSNRNSRIYSQDIPAPAPIPPPIFPSRFNNPYREEAPFPGPHHYHQQMLNDNEIYRERNTYSQQARSDEWERANTFPTHRGKPPIGQWQDDEQSPHHNKVPANAFMEFPGQKSAFGKPNTAPSAIPKPPTAVAIIVPGVGGNSTLFIEYDVSDNDVTYETVMEVEDLPDRLVYSNRVSI